MDESQNTTVEQMKMVLTRMGYGSQAVINGDLTQIDLPKHITSGLDHVIQCFKGYKRHWNSRVFFSRCYTAPFS